MINEPAELPPWLEDGDARLSSIERDFSYWRQMSALTAEEQQMGYVHAYDHRSHYLNPWSSTLLGIEGLRHLRGADAAWDGTEKPGYFLLEATDWAAWWQDWRYPDPLSGTAGFVENPDGPGSRRWVTSHTLKQLHKIDEHLPETLEILEAYTWSESAKYLDKIGAALAEGRAAASRRSPTRSSRSTPRPPASSVNSTASPSCTCGAPTGATTCAEPPEPPSSTS